MSETIISGIKSAHQMITPMCRANKGSAAAGQEAFENVQHLYERYVGSSNDNTVWHVVLVREELG